MILKCNLCGTDIAEVKKLKPSNILFDYCVCNECFNKPVEIKEDEIMEAVRWRNENNE